MTLAFVVYLISISEKISHFLTGVTAFSMFGAFVVAFIGGLIIEKLPIKSVISLIVLAALSALLNSLIPTEKQGYAIAAAYATQTIAESPQAQEIGGKLLTVINQKLDNAIEEGKQKK